MLVAEGFKQQGHAGGVVPFHYSRFDVVAQLVQRHVTGVDGEAGEQGNLLQQFGLHVDRLAQADLVRG